MLQMPAKKEKPIVMKQNTDVPIVNRIFDVAKPGTLPPADATTRPVIVTNRTIMHDPMMVKPVTTNPDAAPRSNTTSVAVTSSDSSSYVHGSKIDVNPFYAQSGSELSAPGKPGSGKISVDNDSDGLVNDSAIVAGHDAPAAPGAPDDIPDNAPNSTPVDKPADDVITPAEAPESKPQIQSNTYGDDAPVPNDPETARQDKEAAELEASAKSQDELDIMVAKKTYFLPINAVELRRSKHVTIFGMLFIILLALIWLNFALDAGLVTIPGVGPVIQLFDK